MYICRGWLGSTRRKEITSSITKINGLGTKYWAASHLSVPSYFPSRKKYRLLTIESVQVLWLEQQKLNSGYFLIESLWGNLQSKRKAEGTRCRWQSQALTQSLPHSIGQQLAAGRWTVTSFLVSLFSSHSSGPSLSPVSPCLWVHACGFCKSRVLHLLIPRVTWRRGKAKMLLCGRWWYFS